MSNFETASESSETDEIFIDELFEAVQGKSKLKEITKYTKKVNVANLNSDININNIQTFEFIDNNKTLNDCSILNVGDQNEIVNLNYLENNLQHTDQTTEDCNILNISDQNNIVNLNNLENDLQHFVQTIEDYNIVNGGNVVDDDNFSIILTNDLQKNDQTTDDFNVINIDNHGEICNINEFENDLQNIGRKRNIIPNPMTWSRNDTKAKRVRGEEYMGYRRKEKTSTNYILHDTLRAERKIGPTCTSKICEKWKTRNCSTIKNDDRLYIFNKCTLL